MTRVVLTNAQVGGLEPARLESATIVIDGQRIETVGSYTIREGDSLVDCSGRLVVPGNVCGHTHVYSALARGMPAPRQTPHNFPEILEFVWWRLDRALDHAAIQSSALCASLDAIRCGTTTLVDHHASPNAIDGSLDVLATAFEEVGVRAVLCYEVTDRGGIKRRDAGLQENERFIRENRRPTQRGIIGAHASFTLGDDSLRMLAELADSVSTGIHIHVAEDVCDEEDSLRRSGKRTALRLDDAGILRTGSIAAHGVRLDESEIGAIQRSGTWLVHNCRSNLNNSVGRAPVSRFGEKSCLGTDGIDQDMFAESRTAFFRAREDALDTSAETIASMLARGGDLVSRYFGFPIGRFEAGAAADLVVLEYDPPTPLSSGNLPWHWMFALNATQVRSVMVAGRWVLRDGIFETVDEERIRADAREEARKLWRRMDDL